MVLRLACPHCGPRPVEEWVYGEVPDPPDYLTGADERDVDRGFMMGNTEGVKVERWFHSGGCRRWQTITRDTTLD
ncbi:sarcosine oxidase subunit delta [Candidatus Spongiisocius sp.]|uniref:sarcosine oxidase subunit delta n=1 Tax=Candidatus Spongiisocius sp. TaxID=3101273 RepID=UPI003B59334B